MNRACGLGAIYNRNPGYSQSLLVRRRICFVREDRGPIVQDKELSGGILHSFLDPIINIAGIFASSEKAAQIGAKQVVALVFVKTLQHGAIERKSAVHQQPGSRRRPHSGPHSPHFRDVDNIGAGL